MEACLTNTRVSVSEPYVKGFPLGFGTIIIIVEHVSS